MRVAITKVDDYATRSVERKRSGIWKVSLTHPTSLQYSSQMTYDVDLWAIVLANVLQDIPFLLVSPPLSLPPLSLSLSLHRSVFISCSSIVSLTILSYSSLARMLSLFFFKHIGDSFNQYLMTTVPSQSNNSNQRSIC